MPRVQVLAACVSAPEVTSSGRVVTRLHVRVVGENKALCGAIHLIDVLTDVAGVRHDRHACKTCKAELAARGR